MKRRNCAHGHHQYGAEPYQADAGYQQAPDGTRVDGRWLRFRCELCGHVAERWESDDPRAAAIDVEGPWSLAGERPEEGPAARSFWERPALLWAVLVVAVVLAAYGYYWDAHLRRPPPPVEIVRPRDLG